MRPHLLIFFKKTVVLFPLLLVSALLVPSLCFGEAQKRILFVDSYHARYLWSADITQGIRSVLDERQDVELKILRMDTKRNMTEEYKKEAARQARDLIESWQPDVVIASDDNAAKYFIVPFMKDSSLPVVFCGLSWNAAIYGFSTENITGMVEVNPILDTIHRLQKSVDILILLSTSTVQGWRRELAVSFVENTTTIPTGSISDEIAEFTLLGKVKIPEEQGWWAGKTALRILHGIPVQDIPVDTNKSSKLYLNMKLAKRLVD